MIFRLLLRRQYRRWLRGGPHRCILGLQMRSAVPELVCARFRPPPERNIEPPPRLRACPPQRGAPEGEEVGKLSLTAAAVMVSTTEVLEGKSPSLLGNSGAEGSAGKLALRSQWRWEGPCIRGTGLVPGERRVPFARRRIGGSGWSQRLGSLFWKLVRIGRQCTCR